ncbi:wuschel-related homeobox 11 [Phtheirospermum japonicum]|uniref:Wuschel-related homeobox 11 n=1 Tax=Phtheirospermum japonicum TaxID=374723 RepID=A0A830BMU8_9LAMI|nr:wuschel-related homeobox 11 [Phtheirospermum japonicum]
MILESIFNSGIVNPSKEETVRIRKLLEKYGQVANANVFYWFQNRRSRSRRRQRQLEAKGGASSEQPPAQAQGSGGGGHTIQYADYMSVGLGPHSMSYGTLNMGSPSYPVGPSSSSSVHGNDTSMITVFINGVPTEVETGPVDIKSMFDGDFLMYHSSGMQIQVNEYGVVQTLHHGESYIVVIIN